MIVSPTSLRRLVNRQGYQRITKHQLRRRRLRPVHIAWEFGKVALAAEVKFPTVWLVAGGGFACRPQGRGVSAMPLLDPDCKLC
jgi:hypothetical protein